MRITLVGTFGRGHLAESLGYAFTCLGHRVSAVSDEPLTPATRLGRVIAREHPGLLRLTRNWRRQARLGEAVIETSPDLTIAVKAPHLQAAIIEHIRRRTRAPVLNWYPDNLFVKWGQRPPLRTLRRYDRVIVFSPALASRAEREGLSALFIPFGFDPRYYFPPSTPRVPIVDVAFVGECRPERAALLLQLLEAGFSVRVAGPGWGGAPARLRPAWHEAPTWGADAGRFYHGARVGLNDLHPESNAHSHNMRTWEIPATGTPMVTTDSAHQRELLRDLKTVAYYTGVRDLPDAVRRVIGETDAAAATNLSAHTYQERCRDLIAAL